MWPKFTLPIVLTSLVISACSALSTMPPIGQGPLGTVALERVSIRGTTARYSTPQAFHASHPATISPSVTARLLTGLTISGLDGPHRTTGPDTFPLFSQEEVEFLAPLVSAAFHQAQPDQRITFMVKDDGMTTQGYLFAYHTTIQVALVHYRTAPTANSRSRQPTLSFTPGEALVRLDPPEPWMVTEPEWPRVAIAVEALHRRAPSPAPMTEPTPAKISHEGEQQRLQQELQATKDLVVKQAEELQQLKEELDTLRRQRSEKPSAPPKTTPKAGQRKPAATPTP
ncbi:MAG: hypothetical protein NBKEAIPA_01552 [Nitrospirae bacterium]|nr:MAG: hypothetical protein UZ03_NOB001000699 [Nitrospira sp. OLB3]MBV6469650.1 hypothetical protein [Nitrospirota bacterium]